MLFCSSRGELDNLKELYEKYHPDLNSADYDGRTCLHVASGMGHIEIVRYLLNNGANVNVYDRFGGSPRDDAIRYDRDDITELLIRAGASKPAEAFELELIRACSKGDLESVRRLLNNKVDPNCCDYDRRTPLHLAVDIKNVDIVKLLLKSGADKHCVDRFGNSPLSDAKRRKVRVGNDEILQLLNDVSSNATTRSPISYGIIYIAALQLIIAVLYIAFAEYNNNDSKERNSKYSSFQHLHIMIFIGFGFITTFLRKHGFSSIGYTFIIAAIVLQLHPLFSELWNGLFNKYFTKIKFDVLTFILGDFAACTVLISYGAMLGKIDIFQLVTLGVFETIFYSLNEHLCKLLVIRDTGGSMSVHLFGALFGLACSKMLKNVKHDTIENVSVYHSDIFSMIGTLFLWVYWPSCTSLLTDDPVSFNNAVINTLISLTSSCVFAFITSYVLRGKNKFCIVDIQNATLAGGVAIGSICDLPIGPGMASLIGIISGTSTVIGFIFIQSRIEGFLSIYDTCGVFNLHGIPGFIGGITSVISVAVYNQDNKDTLYQLAFIFITISISIVSGLVTGFIINKMHTLNSVFLDDEYWDVPEMEKPYYFDVRGEVEHKSVVSSIPVTHAEIKKMIEDETNKKTV
jgi:ammonium transporter Rh